MARRKPTAEQQAFSSGLVVEQLRKVEAKLTQFEQTLERLGLTEANCHENPVAVAWINAHRNSRFIPEKVLRSLRLSTLFDEGELAPYSLTASGVVTRKRINWLPDWKIEGRQAKASGGRI